MREFNGVIDVNAILEESGFGNVGEKSKKRLFDAVQKAIDVFKADLFAVVAADIADLETQKADLENKAALLAIEIRSFDSVKANVYAADTALRNALSIISAAKASMNPMNIPEGPSDALVCVHCGSKKDVWGRTVIYPGGDFKILNLCAPCNKKMREPAESVAAPAAPRMRVRCITPYLSTLRDFEDITFGREFDVEKEDEDLYLLAGVNLWADRKFFEVLSGPADKPIVYAGTSIVPSFVPDSSFKKRVRCIDSIGPLIRTHIYTVVDEIDFCYALEEVAGWFSISRFKDVSCDENTEDSI